MSQIKTSFDATAKEGMKKVFNAKSGASLPFKNLEDGTELNLTGVMIHEDADSEGKVNKVTTLFTADGTAYAGISSTVSETAESLIDYMVNTGDEEVGVKIVKAKSSAGREFFNLLLV